MAGLAKFEHVVAHPLTRALGGALLFVATLLINDVRGTVAEQSEALHALKADLNAYKAATTTEDVRLGARIDGLQISLGARIDGAELKLELQQRSLDERVAQWDAQWRRFLPQFEAWLARQDRRRDPDD